MKKFLFTFIVSLFFINTFAQVSYYMGEWTTINKHSNFSGFMKLEIKDTSVSAEIIWTYYAIDSTNDLSVDYYKGRKGKMGIEFLSGIFSPSTNDIQIQGASKLDPDAIIGLDKYLLKLSANKEVIYGRTLSNGDNNGLVYMQKINSVAGENKFYILKNNLISYSQQKASR